MSNTISGLNTINSNATSSTGAAAAGSTLDTEAFMRLMVAQLSNQNPLQPMDDTQFYAQMAQLGTVQGIDNMQKSMQVSEASALLGKTVTASVTISNSNLSYNAAVKGTVMGLSNNNGTYTLSVKDATGNYWDVDLANITSVQN